MKYVTNNILNDQSIENFLKSVAEKFHVSTWYYDRNMKAKPRGLPNLTQMRHNHKTMEDRKT